MSSKPSPLMLLPLLLVGCGDDTGPRISATLRIDSALAADVYLLRIFALGPELTDGVKLACTALTGGSVKPSDDRVVKLVKPESLIFQEPDSRYVTLENVESGPDRFVYVDAFDVHDFRIGAGCKKGDVPAGGAWDVTVTVYSL